MRSPLIQTPQAVRQRFLRRALLVTLLVQLPGLFVLRTGLLGLNLHISPLLLAGALLLLNSGFVHYVRTGFPEKRLSNWSQYLLVLPAFLWFFTCLLLLVPMPLFVLLRLLFFDSATGSRAKDMVGYCALGSVALALLTSLYAMTIRRRHFRITRLDVPFDNLPPNFDGYRIAQLSDLHIGNFVSPTLFNRWMQTTLELRPDLIVITGDLIASGTEFLDTLANGLQQLSAPDGVFISLGNHDYFTDHDQLIDALTARGLPVLRNEGRCIERSGQQLFLAAVDDTWSGRADLRRALSEHPSRHTPKKAQPEPIPTIMLSHDPTLFPDAAAEGVELMLSGHTHGGQIALPFRPHWNLSARAYAYSSGLYRIGRHYLYVHRGLGTTGPPLRLGAAPEIAVLTLRLAISSGDSDSNLALPRPSATPA